MAIQGGYIMQNNNNFSQTANQTGPVVTSYVEGQTAGAQSQGNMNTQTMSSQAGMTSQAAMANPTSGKQANASGEQKVVIGIFQSKREAEQAVNQLRSQGFTNQEINIVSKQDQKQTEYAEDDITDGALTGGTLGGIGGLLLGAGALAIPGLGPIVAVGPIAAALSGAVMGGVAGGLIDWGIPEEVSRRYENSVREGGILAVIRTSATSVNQAATILRQNGAQDVESHASNA
jgi:uncharacterized membrane protein